MPYNEPTFGESGEVYTDNVRNSLAHVKSAAEAAQATADNAVASVVTASQTADEAKEIALAAQGYLETPTDGRMAEHINDPASETAQALSASYATKAENAAKANTADVPALAATKNVFTGKAEYNGGFTNSMDTTVWVAPTARANPTVASQSVYAQHRVSGNLGGVVHDAMAAELRVSGASNATFLNAFEATAEVTGGANTIPDMRAITANFLFSGSPTGTIDAASVIRAQAIPAGTGPAITTAYGLYVENQTAGATNYSVYAPTGTSLFGAVTVSGTATVNRLTSTTLVDSLGSEIRVRNSGDTGTFFSLTSTGPRWNDAGLAQTTVGAAGAASALPAAPAKYLKVRDSAGTVLVIPAYAAS